MGGLCEDLRAVSPDATRLCTELMADPLHRLDRAEELRNTYGVEIPFLFTDFNPATTDDEETLREVDRFIGATDARLNAAGISFGSQDYIDQFVRATRTFVQDELRVHPEKSPTLNAIDTIRAGKGPCVGIDIVYYGIFLLAKLNPMIQFQFDESSRPGELLLHTRLAFSNKEAPQAPLYIVDAAKGVFGQDVTPEPYVELSPAEFIAVTYVNQLRDKTLPLPTQLERINIALALSQKNSLVQFMALHDAIGYYDAHQDWTTSGRYLREAVSVNPAGEKVLMEKFPQTASRILQTTAPR